MRKFKINQKPFDGETKLYDKKFVTFETGVTVLIGCNGSGKTTLLHSLRNSLWKERVPVLYIDTLTSARDAVGSALWKNDMAMAASAFSASEGERMQLGLGQNAARLRTFIMTGEGEINDFGLSCGKKAKYDGKERWLLIDSADSGLSIDALQDVQSFLDLVIEDSEKLDKELYIVISTNQYELTAGRRCLNAQTLRPISIRSYETYKKAILKSRLKKDERDGCCS